MNRTCTILLRPSSLLPRHTRAQPLTRFLQTQAHPTTSSPPATKPPKRRRLRAAYLWYGAIFLGGSGLGIAVRNFAAPPELPLPGTAEDAVYLEAGTKEIENLEIVKYMRTQCHSLSHSDPDSPTVDSLKKKPVEESVEAAAQEGWTELDITHNIAEAKDTKNDTGSRTRTATSESIAGVRGLGVQRAFWNSQTRELVAVVWIGRALSGWPGLAHGGAIVTIFQDCMAKMIAGPNVSIDTVAEPSAMSVTYAKKTKNQNFYVVRAHFSKPDRMQTEPPPEPVQAPARWFWLPRQKDLTKKEQPTGWEKTVEIIGTLEDTSGDLLVRAKGTFPVAG